MCKKEGGAIIYTQGGNDEMIIEIISQLGIKPSHNLVDKFEKIIFTESSNDIDFWEIAANKLRGETLNKDTLLLLPGGGDSLNNFVDIEYFIKCQRTLRLLIDSDIFNPDDYDEATAKSLQKKVEHNKSLSEKFTQMGGVCFTLQKRCIENYYHPRAIERLLHSETTPIPYDTFPATMDIPAYIAQYKNENDITTNLKLKNNTEVFNEMTQREWAEVSNSELEIILEDLLSV